MARRRRAKRPGIGYRDIELNIMPFIDVFSLLNTFLLLSAVFFSLGMLEVQLPFFSNAPQKDSKPTRDLSVKVEMEQTKIKILTSYSMAPVNASTSEFPLSPKGIEEFHAKLIDIRRADEKTKKLTLYCEDDVVFDDLAQVLEAIKTRREEDPELFFIDDKSGIRLPSKNVLFAQVVMGSVLL